MKTLVKNGKLHQRGETNQRLIKKCACCGSAIKVGEGYKIINSSTYVILHKECIVKYYQTQSHYIDNSTYINEFKFDITIWGKHEDIDYLKMLGYTPSKNFKNCITFTSNTLNKLRVIESLGIISRIDCIITHGLTFETCEIVLKKADSEDCYQVIRDNAIKLGIYDYTLANSL